jgi:RNA polymerase sigma-32 factor
MAAIQEYIVRNSSIVRIGTTPAQKSLFFNLRRLRARVGASPVGGLTDDQRNAIARELGVPVAAVERMEAHMSRPDRSLNATVGDDDGDELQDFLPDDGPSPEEVVGGRHDDAVRHERLHKALDALTPRERQIIARRFLEDDGRTTLAEIGATFGVTKERIRQIEGKALDKLRDALDLEADSRELFPR